MIKSPYSEPDRLGLSASLAAYHAYSRRLILPLMATTVASLMIIF